MHVFCALQMHLLDAVEFLDKPSGKAELKFDRTAPNENAIDCDVYGFYAC